MLAFASLQAEPWLTGPLIVPQGTVIPYGHVDIEPYLIFVANTGVYDRHWHAQKTPNFYSFNPQLFGYFGLTQWMDIGFIAQSFSNFSQGKSSSHFGDLDVGFDFQPYAADASTWFPGIKVAVREVFPTGKYQHMDPDKLGTDGSGLGAYGTIFEIVFYKLYHIKDLHYLSISLSYDYLLNTSVRLHGFNVYGGDLGTKGKVHPGSISTAIFSFEYTFNQNWVFALDNVYVHANKTRFQGKTMEPVGRPSSEQFSFAPAIEYNFSKNFGIITGAWVTAFGRNSVRFRDGLFTFNYYY
jgi:hypothetical protein